MDVVAKHTKVQYWTEPNSVNLTVIESYWYRILDKINEKYGIREKANKLTVYIHGDEAFWIKAGIGLICLLLNSISFLVKINYNDFVIIVEKDKMY